MMDELPPGWAPVKLREVVEILDNKRIPINNSERTKRLSNSTTRFPYYGATGQVGEIDDFIFEGEAVLLGEDGAPFFDATRSKAYTVDGRYWVNNHAHILRGKDGVSNRFLCHQLNRIDYRPYVAGTTRLKLTQGAMSDIRLVLAPSHEQERIASKIDELFSRIDEGERALERVSMLVERYRQSVLKAAVTGELTRAWREKNKDTLEPGEALLARILTARREAWEKAELEKMKAKGVSPANDKWKRRYEEPQSPDIADLPALPEGWTWASLAQLSWASSYGTSQKCDAAARGVAVLRIPNIRGGAFNFEDIKYATTDLGLEASDALAPGDLLVIRTNGSESLIGVGAVLMADTPFPCHFASYLIRFRLVLPSALSDWVNFCWQSHVVRQFIYQHKATSAGQYNVSQSTLMTLCLPVPPVDEIIRAVNELRSSLSKWENAAALVSAHLRHSAALRQGVLKSAFFGGLIPQSPSDEPASILLERIAADRATDVALPRRGRNKKPAP